MEKSSNRHMDNIDMPDTIKNGEEIMDIKRREKMYKTLTDEELIRLCINRKDKIDMLKKEIESLKKEIDMLKKKENKYENNNV